MPNRDGTGPEGKGPRTGRQMGKCQDANPQETRRPRLGLKGLGKRIGRGQGFQRRNFNEE